jgi:hypothetical protein
MKKVTLLTVFITLSISMMAQSVVLCEPNSNLWLRRISVSGTPLGQDADNLYYYVSPRLQSKNVSDYIYIVDKNSMQSSEINVSIANKFFFLDGIVTDNNIVALYYSTNKKGDQVTFSIANIDKSSPTATVDENNSVSTTANSRFWPSYQCTKSPDGKMLAALVMVTGKDSQLENLFAVVVNDQGEFVWSGPVTPNFGGRSFSLGNLLVDNDGNLYLAAHTCQMNGNKVSDSKILAIKANSDGTTSIIEDVTFGTPQNFTAKVLPNGTMVIAGYYTESQTNTSTESAGYFFSKFDIASENFTETKNFRFGDNYNEKEKWARFAAQLGNQQYSINADDIYELENGSLVLCGEHRFTKEIYDAQMHSYNYHMLTKNILVSTLLPDGTSQFSMVEKQQAVSLGVRPPEDWKTINISYSAFAKGNDMYFLFTDDPKNIPYPGKDVVCSPGGLSFKKKWESVLMRLTPDQELTQRVLPDPNQLLRNVEFVDGDSFYASGVGKSQLFLTKYPVNE